MDSNVNPKIAQIMDNKPDKIVFTEKQMYQLYDLAIKLDNNSISLEELITELRGGEFKDWGAAFAIIIAIITVLNNVDAFQVPPAPGPHLVWLYGNQHPGNHHGHGKEAGPRSSTIVKATQNAGSDKKQSSAGILQEAYSQIPSLSVKGTNEQELRNTHIMGQIFV